MRIAHLILSHFFLLSPLAFTFAPDHVVPIANAIDIASNYTALANATSELHVCPGCGHDCWDCKTSAGGTWLSPPISVKLTFYGLILM